MDVKNGNFDIAREAAHEYVAQAEAFLMQSVGRPFDLKELSDFVEMAGASLLGSMYAILREQEGKEKSEAWLKKVMVLLSSTVRMRGADALVKAEISIKDMPNHMAKREELHVPAPVAHGNVLPEQELPKCHCKLEGTETCSPCMTQISGVMQNAFGFLNEMIHVGKKTESICKVCKVKHGDEAIANIIPGIVKTMGLLGNKKEGALDEVLHMIVQLGMTLGIQEMPMTEAVCKKLLAVE